MYRLIPELASDPLKRDLLPLTRPREKLVQLGPNLLGDQDLASLMLGSGGRGYPVEELSRAVCSQIFPDTSSARVPTWQSLQEIPGLGLAKAASIVAGLELGRRVLTYKSPPIHCPEDALVHLQWMGRERKEIFHVLYLDSRRSMLAAETISIGTLDSSLVHPREVFQAAIRHNASALLVAHNHPSGNPEPSPEDLALTRRLTKAAHLLGFFLLDHLIIAGLDWISLRQWRGPGWSGEQMFAA